MSVNPVTGVTWEEPKDTTPSNQFTYNNDRDAVMRQLAENPGKWAKIGQHKTRNAANQVKRRLRIKFPAHQYRTEKQGDSAFLFAVFPAKDSE